MSRYVKYYNERQEAYRTLATMYANWVDLSCPSKEETTGLIKFFTYVGRRFGLLSEFKKLGIF